MIVLLGGPADGTYLDSAFHLEPGPFGVTAAVKWYDGAESTDYLSSFSEGGHDYYIHESEVRTGNDDD